MRCSRVLWGKFLNGAQFTSNTILNFADDRKIDWLYVAPGKPTQKAVIESFNSCL